MKVAACKYPVGRPAGFAEFADRQQRLLGEAAARGARVAVLPEYLSASLAAIQPLRAAWLELFAGIARGTGMHVLAGSFLLAQEDGRYRNRSDLFAPDGGHLWQDKLQLTGFEKATGIIAGGDALKVVEIGDVRAGVSICYDSEFPLPVRAQYEAGARLLLVPSCTDTAAGATRVQVGCLARALENRMFVAQSVTAGQAPWSPALDENTGEATLYAPMDAGFPSDGILARTRGGETWAIAELDFDLLEATRGRAQVANDRDWPGQGAPALVRARVEGFGPL
jgi:predicted amidohydrolase